MGRKRTMSDHYDNWSDHESNHPLSTPPTPPAAHPVASLRVAVARFAHRALQAVWKARLQVFEGARSWAQVLSFRQSQRATASDGLCASGLPATGPPVAVELPPSPRDFRRDLSDQPGTAAASRTALGRISGGHEAGRNPGSADGRHPGRQYARGLARDARPYRVGTGGGP